MRCRSERASGWLAVRDYAVGTELTGGETLDVAGIAFDVVAIPGHSPDHVAFFAEGCLFSGDLIFASSVGRVDLAGGDWDTLLESARMLTERFPAETTCIRDTARRRRSARSGSETRTSRSPPVMARFEAPRGTHDILPSEQPRWRWVTRTMEEVCAAYGYRPIQTPGIEDTDLIIRTSGEGSDVVQKETYTFTDRGGRSLTLRPEGTAPIAARTSSTGCTASHSRRSSTRSARSGVTTGRRRGVTASTGS